MANPMSTLPPAVQVAAQAAALDATAASVTRVETSTPSVSGATWVAWAIRVGLLIAGGYGISWAQDFMKWHGDVLPLLATVIATGAIGGWSFISKQIQAWREHQIALASAAASAKATQLEGRPVEVAIQPPPAKV